MAGVGDIRHSFSWESEESESSVQWTRRHQASWQQRWLPGLLVPLSGGTAVLCVGGSRVWLPPAWPAPSALSWDPCPLLPPLATDLCRRVTSSLQSLSLGPTTPFRGGAYWLRFSFCRGPLAAAREGRAGGPAMQEDLPSPEAAATLQSRLGLAPEEAHR